MSLMSMWWRCTCRIPQKHIPKSSQVATLLLKTTKNIVPQKHTDSSETQTEHANKAAYYQSEK